MYRTIPLTRGATARVDAEDYAQLAAMGRWSLSNKGYALHWTTLNGQRKALYMHRIIMNAPPDLQVDHINHNRLDNRRENLRFATRSENNASRHILKSNTSGFTGVSRNGNRWECRIRYQKQRIYLGSFTNPLEAAMTYDVAALFLFEDFAVLNCPDKSPSSEMVENVMTRLVKRGIKTD